MTFQKAQERYDNMQPDEEAEEHNYSGEIDIKGVVFCYEDGKLEQVIMPWDKYMNLSERTRELYLAQADAEAYEAWTKSEEERRYNDY